MGEEITTIDISNAEELSASSFTNVKNSINIKIDNSGDLTDTNANAVTMLNFGNRGDHCVTVINAELPSNFSEGYRAYFLVNLKNKTYIQKCLMEGNIAKALITKEISLDSQSTECLFALIEASATTGNLREQEEIFISDVFMGTVRSNFLDSNWMNADISVSEDLTVLDKFETPNPDKYTSMIWVNGETKLNAANMNNIIKGIDELKGQAVKANPTDEATEPLTKLKVGNTTYNFNETLEKNGIYSGVDGNSIFNGISVSAEEFEKIKNGVVRYIYGTYKSAEDQEATPYFASYLGKSYDGETTSYVFHYGDTTIDYGFLSVESINLIFQEYQGEIAGAIIINKSHAPSTPSIPSDSSSKTYTLKSVNGVLTWVDISVDTQRFKNVEVSGYLDVSGSITTPRGFVYPTKQEDFICNASDLTHNSGDERISMSERASASFTTFFNNSCRDKWLLRARINIGFSTGNPISIAVTPNLDTALTRKGFEGSFLTKANGVVSFGAIVDNNPGCYFHCSDHTIIDTYFSYISRIIVEITYADITEA